MHVSTIFYTSVIANSGRPLETTPFLVPSLVPFLPSRLLALHDVSYQREVNIENESTTGQIPKTSPITFGEKKSQTHTKKKTPRTKTL